MEEGIKKKSRKGAEIWALKSFRDRSRYGMEDQKMIQKPQKIQPLYHQ